MADNAIDKLIEEMRAAKEAIFAAECGVADAKAAVQAAEEKHRMAAKRHEVLERTMHKHIYEHMPVVQAKMQAHEEIKSNITNIAATAHTIAVGQPTGIAGQIGNLSANSASSAATAAQIAKMYSQGRFKGYS
ncbi:hypothetical protein [Sphingobium yanoikuyae]|jgi:hypothetical protein|uniref:hypothetical protein n=1 Tax=Sphingobium yanoikuyae TaxID=13690 RepID=UPI00241FA834|nr:hypothetical protein [Sphingobium yanoikuyae]